MARVWVSIKANEDSHLVNGTGNHSPLGVLADDGYSKSIVTVNADKFEVEKVLHIEWCGNYRVPLYFFNSSLSLQITSAISVIHLLLLPSRWSKIFLIHSSSSSPLLMRNLIFLASVSSAFSLNFSLV